VLRPRLQMWPPARTSRALEITTILGRMRWGIHAVVALFCGLVVACGNKPSGPCGSNTQHGAVPPDGNLMWCTDGDGKKHGVFREWWPSGKQKIDARYEHGVQHGPSVTYYENGTKQEEGRYSKGLRLGQWKSGKTVELHCCPLGCR